MQFSWTRYWKPLDREQPSTESLFEEYFEEGSVDSFEKPLTALENEECLVLLGEVGAGKTNELDQYEQHLEDGDKSVQKIDFGEVGESAYLRKLDRVWETSTEFEEPTYLLLDSLDETGIPNPLALLRDEYLQAGGGEIRLRVACRPQYWLSRLESFKDCFHEIWSDVRTFQIEPLTKEDAVCAARESGMSSPDAFWAAVQEAGAEPLIEKPVTLLLLLEEYRAGDGNLPETRTDLFQSACKRLCEEQEERRREDGRLEVYERLNLSRRLAALTIFGQRRAIWLGASHKRPSDQDLLLEEAVSRRNANEGNYTVKDLKEVTDTGLLRGSADPQGPPKSISWAERTLAEFLAAEFVDGANLSLNQLLDLLAAPSDDERGIAPQMQDVAAWIASWNEQLFQHILETDPEILLLGDVSELDPDQRIELSRQFLEKYAKKEIQSLSSIWKVGFRHLSSPNLADALGEYLSSEVSERARRVTIDMARQNEIQQLAIPIREIALSEDETLNLRIASVRALSEIGVEDDLEALIQLLQSSNPEEELEASVLQVLYPDHVGVAELLPTLAPPEREKSTLYTQFIEDKLYSEADPSDLPLLLDLLGEWYQQKLGDSLGGEHFRPLFEFEEVVGEALRASAKHLESRQIRTRVGDWVYSLGVTGHKLPKGRPLKDKSFAEVWGNSEEIRRQVLSYLLNCVEVDVGRILISPLIRAERDLPFIFRTALHRKKSTEKAQWAELGVRVALVTKGCSRRVLPYLSDEVIREQLLHQIEKGSGTNAIRARKALVDHQAKINREKKKRIEESQRKASQRRKKTHVTPTQLQALLDFFEEKSSEMSWVRVHKPLGQRQGKEDLTDVTDRAVWGKADEELRIQIVNSAQRYLISRVDEDSELISTDLNKAEKRRAVAAFRLIQNRDSSLFDDFDEGVWEFWASPIVAYDSVSSEDTEDLQKLIERVYSEVPDVVAERLRNQIRNANEDLEEGEEVPTDFHVLSRLLSRLERIWDDRLLDVLAEEAQRPETTSFTLQKLLPVLLKKGSESHVDRVVNLLDIEDKNDSDDWKRAAEASISLLCFVPHQAWESVYSVLESHDQLADLVIKRLANRRTVEENLNTGRLGSDALLDLYLRVVDFHPPVETNDQWNEEAVSSGIKGVPVLRGSIIGELVERGEVRYLQQIQKQLPNQDWVGERIREAKQKQRESSWEPHSPQDILEITTRPKSRLVRTEAELLSVVEEALQDFEDQLRGHTPAVYDVWSFITRNQALRIAEKWVDEYEDRLGEELEEGAGELAQDVLKWLWRRRANNQTHALPKEEEFLSDYVQRYLKDVLEGVVINREVSVSPGDYTDLYVSTFTRRRNGEIQEQNSIVVEVKGSWNDEVYKGVQEQLVDQYFDSSDCSHGIYLVGWHHGAEWTDEDPRKGRAKRGDINSMRGRLQQRIDSIDDDERVTVRSVVVDLSLDNGRAVALQKALFSGLIEEVC